jgi:hypothetical protein
MGAVASLYLASLFLLLIAPPWIGLILLAVALVMTFVVIGQNRNRPSLSPLDRSSQPPRNEVSRNRSNNYIDKNATRPFAVGCLILGVVVGLFVLVLFIRYALWVSNCGPGGCL